ncbi:AEC family transporter [Janibacter melonis]|uniref:AEC family transporter n=1 Tax=Janibacter melonis TaxID=262209 RepID=UPI0025B34095|nr:AEC family transporter [Janibacter melonis]
MAAARGRRGPAVAARRRSDPAHAPQLRRRAAARPGRPLRSHGRGRPRLGLKLAVMPVVAWAVASALGLEGPALLGVVLTAALPSAQNIFLHATRYRVGQDVARETILVTTVAALPVALVVAAVLG